MNITEQEIQQLQDAPNDIEWNKTVDEIKAKRGGQYPPDWYARVILSGLRTKVNLGITTTILRG